MESKLANDNDTLQALGQQCHRLLQDLSIDSNPEVISVLEHELQRYDLWSRNVGLRKGGHASLDYRFRDAPFIYGFAKDLLRDTIAALSIVKQETLRTIVDHFDNQREQIAQDQALTEPDDSDDDEILESYASQDTASVALRSISSSIDRLYRLSFRIRNPALRLANSKANTYDERYGEPPNDASIFDLYEQWDMRNIREFVTDLRRRRIEKEPSLRSTTFSDMDPLIVRLARANKVRRRQFRYWRSHHLKITTLHRDEAGNDADLAKTHSYDNRKHEEEGSVSTYQHPLSATTATAVVDTQISIDDQQSVISSSSVRWIEEETDSDEAFFPTLPPEYHEKSEFECPYCYVLCSSSMTKYKHWKTHVLRDLRPYVCLQENCNEGELLFDTFQSWAAHQNEHSTLQNKDTSPDRTFDTCPFCGQENARLAHVATHLQRVALMTLPSIETQDSETNSHNVDAAVSDHTEDLEPFTEPEYSSTSEKSTTEALKPLTQNEQNADMSVNSPPEFPAHLTSMETTSTDEPEKPFRWPPGSGTSRGAADSTATEAARKMQQGLLLDHVDSEMKFLRRNIDTLATRLASAKKLTDSRDFQMQSEITEKELQNCERDFAALAARLDLAKESELSIDLESELLSIRNAQGSLRSEMAKLDTDMNNAIFEDLFHDEQCRGTTKKGQRCRMMIDRHALRQLEDGEARFYCQHHKRQAGATDQPHTEPYEEEDPFPEQINEGEGKDDNTARLAKLFNATPISQSSVDSPDLDQKTKESHHGLDATPEGINEQLTEQQTSEDTEDSKPIEFKDAIGRKFVFPWRLARTWKTMEELIRQAFRNVDVLEEQVNAGHYDLTDGDGYIILPQVWDANIRPGLSIIMHMWPVEDVTEKNPWPPVGL